MQKVDKEELIHGWALPLHKRRGVMYVGQERVVSETLVMIRLVLIGNTNPPTPVNSAIFN